MPAKFGYTSMATETTRPPLHADPGTLMARIAALEAEVAMLRRQPPGRLQVDERFRAFTQHSPDMVYVLDAATWQIQYVNRPSVFGYGPAELTSMSFLESRIPPEDIEILKESRRALIKSKDSRFITCSYRFLNAAGETEWIQAREAILSTNPDGSVRELIGFYTIVTEQKRTERALVESEIRFRTMFESAPIGVVITNRAGVVSYANESMGRLLGIAPQQLVGKPLLELMHPEDRELNVHLARNLRSDDAQQQFELEKRFLHSSGHVIIGKIVTTPLFDDLGEPSDTLVLVEDITDRKTAEASLQASEQRFRSLIQNSSDIVITYSGTWNSTYVSPSITTVLGYPADSAVNLKLAELIPQEDLEKLLKARSQVLATDNAEVNFQTHVRRKNGNLAFVDVKIYNLLNDPGVQSIVVSVRDLTGVREAEDALRRSEQRFRAVIQNSSDIVVMLDATFRRIYVSPSVRTVLGYTQEEFVDLPVEVLLHPDEVSKVYNVRRELLTHPGLEQNYLARHNHKDGRLLYLEVRSVNLLDDAGVGAIVTTLRNVTQAVRADKALRRSEERFRALIQNSTDIIITLDEKLRRTYVSPSVEKVLGYTPEAFLVSSVFDVIHPDDRSLLEERYQLGMTSKAQHDQVVVRYRRSDGNYAYMDANITNMLDNPAIQSIVVVLRDITLIKQAEEEIRRSETRFRSLIQNSSDIIILSDAEGRRLYVTPSVERVLDFAPDEFLILDLKSSVHPDDVLKLQTNFRTAAAHPGPIYTAVARYRKKLGGYAFIETRLQNLMAEPGVEAMVTVLHDVTQTHEAEQNLLASLQEKEVLLKEIYHRVKNNLQVVSSLLDFQKDQTDDPAVKELLQESQNRIYSIGLVHERLYQSQDLHRIPLNEYVDNLLIYIRQVFGAETNVHFDIKIPRVDIDIDLAMRMGLVLNELLSNAMKYAFPGGRKGTLTILVEAPEGKLTRMLVADDGVGLPPDATPTASGSLGLRLIDMITRQMRAKLTLSRDQGTSFEFIFKQ